MTKTPQILSRNCGNCIHYDTQGLCSCSKRMVFVVREPSTVTCVQHEMKPVMRHKDIAERAMVFCDANQEESNEALSLIRELWPALVLERDRRIRTETKPLYQHAASLLAVVKALAAGPEPCRMCARFPHQPDCNLIHLISECEGK